MRSDGARVTGAAAWSVLLALVLVACGGGDDGGPTRPDVDRTAPFREAYEDAGPFSVLVGSTSGPGTVLADGITVAPGSRLLGAPFPDVDGAGGFLALLLITGDPVAVYNAYVDMAQAMGMTVGGPGGCLPGFGTIVCARTLTDPSDGETIVVRVERQPAPPGYVSHAVLRYGAPGTVDPATVGPESPAPPTSVLPPAPLPASVPRPSPSAWNLSVAPEGPGLRELAGSLLVAAPGPCGCAPAGWSAVLRITGSPARLVDGYAAQFGAVRPRLRRSTVGDRRVAVADLGLLSGGFTQFRTVTEAGATYLLVAVARP